MKLEDILNDCFFNEYWEKESIKFENIKLEYNIENFNRDLSNAYKLLGYPRVKLIKQGKCLDPNKTLEYINDRSIGQISQLSSSKISSAIDDGYTLVINGLERFSTDAKKICNEVAKLTKSRVQINAYFSKYTKQGFNYHYDTHNILIYQVYGSKNWEIEHAPLSYPIAAMPSSKFPIEGVNPISKLILKAGDVLYLPRGLWHQAEASEGPSLHFSIGMHKPTMNDYLTYSVDKLSLMSQDSRYLLPELCDEFKISEKLTTELIKLISSKLNLDNFYSDLKSKGEEECYNFKLE